MMKPLPILICLALLILACRLPYELGRRLSPVVNGAPTGTHVSYLPGVSAGGDEATTAPAGMQTMPAVTAYPVETATPSLSTFDPLYPGLSVPTDVISGAYPAQPSELPVQLASPLPGETGSPAAPRSVTATAFQIPTATTTTTPTPTRTPLPLPPWRRAPLEATVPQSFQRASGGVQLVEFFAYWSGPSQAMAPIVQGVAEEYAGQVTFVYLDVDNPAVEPIAEDLGFESVPHFFLLDAAGHVLDEWNGYVAVADLRAAMDAALNP